MALLISRQHVMFVPLHLVCISYVIITFNHIYSVERHGTQSNALDYMALSLVC